MKIKKKITLAIVSVNAHKMNWKKISESWESLFILFASKKEKYIFQNINTSEYFKVYFIDDFSFESLSHEITALKKEWVDSDVSLVSNHENDILTSSKVREHFGFKGMVFNEAVLYLDKNLMKNQVKKKYPQYLPNYKEIIRTENPILQWEALQKFINKNGYPVFIKPTNSAGSLGAKKINDLNQIKSWFDSWDRKSNYEIDSFISGKVYHVDMFFIDNNWKHILVSQYLNPPFAFLLGYNHGSIMCHKESQVYSKGVDFSKKILECFPKYNSTAYHLEFIQTEEGHLYFLEVACRAGGTNVSEMYVNSGGADFQSLPYMSLPSKDNYSYSDPKSYSARLYIHPKNYNKFKSKNLKKLKSLANVEFREINNNVKTIGDRAAQIIINNNDYQTLKNEWEYLADSFYNTTELHK